MKTVQSLWQEYLNLAAPHGAGATEIAQHRKTFYAGAIAMFFAVTDLGDDGIPEAQAEEQLIHFQKEIAAHIAAVLADQRMKGDSRVKH